MTWRKVWLKRILQMKRRYRNDGIYRARLISKLAFAAFILVIIGIVGGVVVFAWVAKDLPRPDKIVRKEGFASKIFDRNGKPLYDVYEDQKRIPVAYEETPTDLKNAIIAIEDKNFYKHKGFDFRGILRAAYNIIRYRKLQGGSTLTQQLVKNVLLTTSRTMARKVKELILTIQIENKYSKNEILQMYLNEAPYGGTAWGIGAAAELYFNKKVSELTLAESSIMAALPQRPSYYSPFGNTPKAYISRTKEVLRRMQEDGYISAEQEKKTVEEISNFQFASEGASFKAPHFVMYVKKLLEDKYGQQIIEQGGLNITTSLDLDLQEKAQEIVTEEIKKVEKIHITNGAAVAIDSNTGEILAMVGSKDYFAPDYDGKVNVTLSLRQPGSTIKPVTYLTALRKGYNAATMIVDSPTVFPPGGINLPDYKPLNYDGKFHGPMQLRYALGNSINIPAVKLLAMVGIKENLTTAYGMGISTLEPTKETLSRLGLSMTLGGGEVRLLEISTAYSAFSNGGFKVPPTAILKVVDQKGNVLDEFKPTNKQRAISAQEAFIISDILADNKARAMTFGERSALVIPDRMVAVKTGTTNDRRDNWTIGWTSAQVVVGVWVGNNDNSAMKEVSSGISGAAPIWRKIIMEALKNKPGVTFTAPEGVVTAAVDEISGYAAHDGFPSRIEYFIQGTEPPENDPIHVKLKVCRGQNKLATPSQIGRGDYEEKEFIVLKENDPLSTDGINRWQNGIDEWLSTQVDSRYMYPREYCGDTSEIGVIIDEPGNESQVNSNDVLIRGRAVANGRIVKIEIFVDDQKKETVNDSSRFEKTINIPDGPHSIRVSATDESGKTGSNQIRIGVKVPWNWSPSPTPTPSPVPTATPIPTNTPVPTPTSG